MKFGEAEFDKVLERGWGEALNKIAKEGIKLDLHEKMLIKLGVAAGIQTTLNEAEAWWEQNKGFSE